MLGFDLEFPAGPPKAKFSPFTLKNGKKSAVQHSVENLFCLILRTCLQPFDQDYRRQRKDLLLFAYCDIFVQFKFSHRYFLTLTVNS